MKEKLSKKIAKRALFLLALLSAMMFMGCGNSADIEEKTGESQTAIQGNSQDIDEEQAETADRIQNQLLENVFVDAQVIVPSDFTGTANVYTASVEGFDEEKVMAALEINKEDFTILAEELYKHKSEEIILQFANNAAAGSLSFHTETGSRFYIYDSQYDDMEEYSHIPNLGEGKEMETFSSEEAQSKILECLKAMEIDLVSINSVCALPAVFQQYEENKRVDKGQLNETDKLGDKWEDSYFMELTTTIDGIPLYESAYVAQDDSAYNGGRITALVSTQGIQYLVVPNQYKIDAESASPQQILSAEQILEKLKIKLENIILTEELTVEELKLYYFPSIIDTKEREFQMTPVWKITLKDSLAEFTYLFHAIDGVEILW